MCTTCIERNGGDGRMMKFSETCPESEDAMPFTAKHKTLVAIRTLIGYFEDDERRDYQELVERGEGSGHIYESIVEIQEWLNGEGQPQVLHMVAGSDDSGLPQADCEVLTAKEAAERFQWLLEDQHLPHPPYNPETDKVLARYEPSDAMGHRFYGFAPMLAENPDGYTELTYESSDIPLDRWQVKINGVIVYQQPDEEEDEADGEEDRSPVPVEARP